MLSSTGRNPVKPGTDGDWFALLAMTAKSLSLRGAERRGNLDRQGEGGAIMIGWRARLGFLVPPGNPTVEAEMMALAPVGVSLHFHRMAAGGGVPGALDNQDARTRTMIDNLDESVALLAVVEPALVGL